MMSLLFVVVIVAELLDAVPFFFVHWLWSFDKIT